MLEFLRTGPQKRKERLKIEQNFTVLAFMPEIIIIYTSTQSTGIFYIQIDLGCLPNYENFKKIYFIYICHFQLHILIYARSTLT